MGSEDKRQKGKYYTKQSPFKGELFSEWNSLVENVHNQTILEPFAGSGNIRDMLVDRFKRWSLYDISPALDEIMRRDTIERFPTGFDICITNPPYLAKNSAKRLKLEYPKKAEGYIDIYLYTIELMLKNCDYCSAIIPASFLTQELFLDRVLGIDLITSDLFDDTDVPVCVAYFVPKSDLPGSENFRVFEDGVEIGSYYSIRQGADVESVFDVDWTFNDPNGWLGLHAVDGTSGTRVRFLEGSMISPENIKHSSRSITRISGPRIEIREVNQRLEQYREDTHDIFMTTFKGKRKDGRYRRRLDFDTARKLLNKTYSGGD